MSRRRVVILGSTGSIGTQALDVIGRNPGRFEVVGLSSQGNDPGLVADQALDYGARHVAVSSESAAAEVRRAIDSRLLSRGGMPPAPPHVTSGPAAVAALATLDVDVVLNGIAGAAGLESTLAALQAGRTVALANKESLIIGGPLVKQVSTPGQIVPVDSEHSALAQCLHGGEASEVRRLILTASGGPFRGWTAEQLRAVTPRMALAHPTWSMGPLVTINSATLVNKGLEVIEAHLLFDIPFDRIDVVVHPQSVVHSMVEFIDGSTLAQASPPDMRIPIAWGLSWPGRVPEAAPACDWTKASTWEFEPLDESVFPAVTLARQAGSTGGTAPAVFNAADEVAVAAFLAGSLDFPGIWRVVAEVLGRHVQEVGITGAGNLLSLSDVWKADAWARAEATALIDGGAASRGER